LQIDLNVLHMWKDMPKIVYVNLRSEILDKSITSPVLENNIKNNPEKVVQHGLAEYKHQMKQVKSGQRKRVEVDFNTLYC
jgi:hypothetical protein